MFAVVVASIVPAACSDPQDDIRRNLDRLELERGTIHAERTARALEQRANYIRLRAISEKAMREVMATDAEIEPHLQKIETERLSVIDREIERLKDESDRLQCEQWLREGRSYPMPADKMSWEDVLKAPSVEGLGKNEVAAMKRQYFIDVIAPLVPTVELKEAWCLFDGRTRTR